MAQPDTQDNEQPFISHLIELRDRLLRSVILVLVIFVVLFSFANTLFQELAVPLIGALPQGSNLIATGVASPFLVPFKLSLVLSIFIAMPFLLYQIWGFIAPGLYEHEKKLAFPLLSSSILLFYGGMAFAYYVVFPLIFAFFVSTTPEGVAMMTDISQYLDFVLKMFFAFGLAFEVPIATILITATGMTTVDSLRRKRPFIIVGAFVFGMLLTPPDIVSQSLLAIPVWLLFEVGVIFSSIIVRRREQADEDEEYHPMSDDEMEAELDKIENDEEQQK